MPSKPNDLLGYLRIVLGAWRNDPRDDDELLARFTQDSDEEAFRVLIWRYGLLVWRSCTRVLGEGPDAEDAFQAAFLALARKASRLPIKNLAGWLHQVARQAALNAQAGARRRQSLEQQLRAVRQPLTEEGTGRAELYAALDEELAGLPEQLRVPLLLHYLEGKSQVEVARLLGCARSVVQYRLARAEAALRKRLERRGLAIGVGSVAVLLGSTAGALAVPARLIGSTARAAIAFRTGALAGWAAKAELQSLSFPPPFESSESVALAEGVMKTMLVAKMKIVAVLLGVTLCLAGGSVLAYRALAGNAAEPPQPAGETREEAKAPRQVGTGARVDCYGDPLPGGARVRLGTTRLRHSGRGQSVAFSPDGKTVVSGGSDGVVHLWEATTGKEIRSLREIRSLQGKEQRLVGVSSVVFSPDGKTVAVGMENDGGRMSLWEAATGMRIRNLELQRPEARVEGWDCIWAMAFSPDGKTLVTGGEYKGVRLWEADTAKEIRTLHGWKEGEGGISSVAFSPDGQTVGAGGHNGVVRLWKAATGKPIHTLKGDTSEEGAMMVAFSPDGKTLAASGPTGVVHLWEADTGKEIQTLKGHKRCVFAVVFSPDGKTVASGGWDRTVRLWESATGKPIHTLKGHKGEVLAMAFAPDGKTLATVGTDQTIRLWEVATGKPIRMPSGHEGSVSSVAFASDGKTVVTAGADQTMRLWETATGKEIRNLQGWQEGQVGVTSVAFSPDSKTAASRGRGGSVRLWKTATGKEIRTLKLRSQMGEMLSNMSEAFSPDGKTLATGWNDGTVCLLEAATGKEIRTLERPKNKEGVLSIAFSPDGKTLAAGGNNGKVRLLDTTTTGGEIRTLKGYIGQVNAVAFSPDSQLVAAGVQNGLVRLWEVSTGKEIRTLQGQNKGNGFTVVFSPDGRTLAAGCGDCVQLWDLPSGDAYPALAGHQGDVLGVTFSSDSRTLASVSADTTGLIWDLSLGATRPVVKLRPDVLPVLWADLASEDAPRARQAVWTLAATPTQSVPLLRDRLQPVPSDMGRRLAQLVADLDADEFKVREKARRGLEELGPDAEPALRKGLEGKPSLERRRRLEQLLEAVREQSKRGGFSGEFLRGLRAVAVLERVGTPEARQVLKTLAAGAPGFRLTHEAQAALDCLDRARRP